LFFHFRKLVLPKPIIFVKILQMDTLTATKSPIQFTPSAIAEIKRLQAEEGFDTSKMLRVGVKGGGCSGMTYVLEFDNTTEADALHEVEGFTFAINNAHSIYLIGMEVDWQGGLNSRGFTFKNPNASNTCGCGTSFAV
jgi:iron-sulfur cluster assembly accessory protein